MNQHSDAQLVVDGLLDFVQKDVVPREEALADILEDPRRLYIDDGRENQEVADTRRQVRIASAEAGYYQMFCPERIGGGGLPLRTSVLCWEALHHRYGPGERLTYGVISHWASGPSVLWTEASDYLARDVRPHVVAGRLGGCFGMSEPEAGSDAWGMKTRAYRDGDTWSITGSKQWTSFAPTADYVLLFAVTNPEMVASRKGGITAFYVPMETEGVRVESVIKLFGEIGGREAILSFDDVRIPDAQRLGAEDDGFKLAMMGASQGRLYNSARSIGLARWALERSVEYAKSRHAGGHAIAEYQSIQNMLADSAVQIFAARSMTLETAARVDSGDDTRRELAMAKLFATNAAVDIFDRAMQVHGGMGLTNELRLHDGWKTARTIRIADGTDEILRRTIARELLRGNVHF
jgi:acyl-CoA dehydrogenase